MTFISCVWPVGYYPEFHIEEDTRVSTMQRKRRNETRRNWYRNKVESKAELKRALYRCLVDIATRRREIDLLLNRLLQTSVVSVSSIKSVLPILDSMPRFRRELVG